MFKTIQSALYNLSTRNRLLLLAIVFALIFIISTSFLYQQKKEMIMAESEKRIDIFMKKWNALFEYVEGEQKNSIYKLQEAGVLDKDYFDPHILSFTYIARQVQLIYEEMEHSQGITPYYYRIAAPNPRNPGNKATEYEEEILERFNKGEIDKFSEIIEKDGESFYFSSVPLIQTDQSCMKCHGDPEDAPGDLVDRYGSTAGFGEQIGEARAMVVTEIPIQEIEEEVLGSFLYNAGILLIILLGAYLSIHVLMKKDASLQKAYKKLDIISRTDALTGVANRRELNAFLEKNWNVMRRYEKPISVILCDIDYFKLYNDRYGHPAGDECLRTVAQTISKSLNRPLDFVARYGGEEFAIVLPDTESNGAVHVAETMRRAVLEAKIRHEESKVSPYVTLSLGVSTMIPVDDSSYDSLLLSADKALYTAKEEGRNRVFASTEDT